MKMFTLLFLSFCSCLATGAYAQVAPLGTGHQAAQVNSLAVTIPAGTNRMLMVTVSDALATDILSVTLSGTPLTQRIEQTDGFAVDAFYTLSLGTSATPGSGTLLVASNAPDATGKFITAHVFQYVDQTTPLISLQSRAGSAASSSFTITSTGNDLVLDLFDTFNGVATGTRTPGAGQTLIHTSGAINLAGAGFAFYGVSTKPGAAPSTNTSWTTSHPNLIHLAGAIQFGAGTLPINLLSFNAVQQEASVQLEWRTEQAVDFSHFEVERSTDARTFVLLADVPHDAASAGRFQYEDKNIPPGDRLYYRLKLVDQNGTYEYSRTVAVFSRSGNELLSIRLAPNPFTERVQLNLYLDAAGAVLVRLTDQSGRQVYINRRELPKGFSAMEIPGANELPRGIYFVTIQSAGRTVTEKLMKN